VKLDNGVVPYAPRSPPRLTVFNRHSLFHNPVICVQRLTGWSSTSQPLSRHILLIDILNLCSLFTVYNFNPYFTVGLQYQATWRALCLGLRIRHLSRGEGESFVPQNPLILRDRVPSFWGWLPLVLRPACLRFRGPSTSGSYWGLLPPIQGPRAFGFRGPCCLRLGFSYLQPNSLRAPTQILMYTYISFPFL